MMSIILAFGMLCNMISNPPALGRNKCLYGEFCPACFFRVKRVPSEKLSNAKVSVSSSMTASFTDLMSSCLPSFFYLDEVEGN